MPTETPTLALADLATVLKVREQHSAECGYPKRHLLTMAGTPVPADCVIETKFACDPTPVLGPDGKTVMYTHPLPAKALKAEVESKVAKITAAAGEQMKAALVVKVEAEAKAAAEAEPVEDLKP